MACLLLPPLGLVSDAPGLADFLAHLFCCFLPISSHSATASSALLGCKNTAPLLPGGRLATAL
eukprot:21676-Karenia_brevis.AAC.1